MNKRKVGTLVVVTGILGLCGLLYAFTMLPHNIKFNKLKKAFSEIHHSESTKFVAGYKLLGVLDYQRTMYKETYPQGCDYLVGQVREYQGNQASIVAFYAKQTVMVEESEERVEVRFIPFTKAGQIDRINGWEEYGPNGVRLLQNIDTFVFTRLDPSKSYYFVFVSDLEFSEKERDIRCLL